MWKFIKDKTILITGGTGYLGFHLARELLKYHPHSIRLFSTDEAKHHRIGQMLNDPRIRNFIGDVRDLKRLEKATQAADIVIHAAALKRIDMIEYNVFEAIQTNVQGSMNVVEACLYNNVEKAILISTDKACSPINTYGATKMLAERIFTESNYSKGKNRTIFTCVRYGNVTESTGSVIPFFKDKMTKNEDVTVTDARMTRFYITPIQAVEQIFKAIRNAKGGEIFVPKLPAFKITDLVDVMKKQYNSKSKVKFTGIRPGEKLDEYMLNEDEATRAYEFENGFVIASQIDKYLDVSFNYLKEAKKTTLTKYSSDMEIVSPQELEKTLTEAKIL